MKEYDDVAIVCSLFPPTVAALIIVIFVNPFLAIVIIDRISDHFRHKLVKGH